MQRMLLALGLAACLAVLSAVPVGATTADISPSSQSHAHNVASHWTASWSGRLLFNVDWEYGDGNGISGNATNVVEFGLTYGWSPCPGDQTNYTQTLSVWDNITHGSSNFASDTSTAHENAGNPC